MSIVKHDLHTLSSWTVASRLVSLEKYGILYCGFNNPEISYELNGSPLPILTEFVELGIVRGADAVIPLLCNQHPD